jgi:transposase
MNVTRHDTIKQLKKEMRLKANLEARDRIHAVILAMKGHSSAEIADRLAHARSWVNKWVGRYSEQGWAGLWDLERKGQPKKLSEEDQEEFEKIVRRGPLPEQNLSRYRAKDLQKILREKFGANYSLSGVKAMLHRLGFSSIKPRPRHPQNDPQAMAEWKQKAPAFVKKVKKNIHTRKSKFGSRTRVGLARKGF